MPLPTPLAIAVSLVPYVVMLAGPVIGQMGGPPSNLAIWLLAVGLIGPAVTARVSLRTTNESLVRTLNAAIVGVVCGTMWYFAVPDDPPSGVWMGPRHSSFPWIGLIIFLGLLVANAQAAFWERRGHSIVAAVFGGATVLATGVVAILLAPVIAEWIG